MARLRCRLEVARVALGARVRSWLRGVPWPEREFFFALHRDRRHVLGDLEPLAGIFDVDRLRAELDATPWASTHYALLATLSRWIRFGAARSRVERWSAPRDLTPRGGTRLRAA